MPLFSHIWDFFRQFRLWHRPISWRESPLGQTVLGSIVFKELGRSQVTLPHSLTICRQTCAEHLDVESYVKLPLHSPDECWDALASLIMRDGGRRDFEVLCAQPINRRLRCSITMQQDESVHLTFVDAGPPILYGTKAFWKYMRSSPRERDS